jgi:hypothetical protein
MSGTGPSNPQPREEPFLDPPGPRPALGRPGFPRKRLRPGLSEPEPAGVQYALDAEFHAPCTAQGQLGTTGPGPRQIGLRCLTPTDSSRLLDYPLKTPCSVGVNLESRAQGPGGRDSDVSTRQNPAARWTRMEDSHVKAGEVVIRKTPGRGIICRGPIHQGAGPSNLLHLSVKASSASTRSRSQTVARLRFPLQTLQTSHCPLFFRSHIVICFSDCKWTPLLLPSLLATQSCPKTVFPRGPCRLHIVSCFSKFASFYPLKIPQPKTNYHTPFVSEFDRCACTPR